NVTPRIRKYRFQISSVTCGTHRHHPRTVDGLTVRPAGPWFVTENFPRTQPEIWLSLTHGRTYGP
ncbi:hypothetical protein MTR67_035651, partial [Solanum verrucosum]